MESNPLHPFELHPYGSLFLLGLDISPNKAVITMWIVIALASWLLYAAGRERRLVPTRLQSVAELLVEFIRGMILDTMGEKGMRFFPFVATLFVFILFCNLLGLIPGTYTVTSQIVVTGAFALFVYGMSIVVGFALHGIKFLGILVPPGTPVLLWPLLVPIEIISQLARPVSLAVRLFANMTAGHTILAVLFGMVVSLPIWIGWLPFAGTLFVNGLEVMIAFIQAYIFTVLTCTYLGDAVTLHGHSEGAH
ncbi:MAG TPA: F0F1 ATP synthase subunit A [Nitrospirales bacterium]|nr:F0F1 ATP synthase subunit A [Nitrospirales bacterium]